MPLKTIHENASAGYMRERRKEWRELGYKNVTATVHSDDAPYVLAQCMMLKWERVLADLEQRNMRTIDLAASCNRGAPIDANDMAVVQGRLEAENLSPETHNTVRSLMQAVRKHMGQAHAHGKVLEQQPTNDSAIAYAVAHSQIAAASFKLAKLYCETSSMRGNFV